MRGATRADVRDGVGGLERGHDPLELREQVERVQRLAVVDPHVRRRGGSRARRRARDRPPGSRDRPTPSASGRPGRPGPGGGSCASRAGRRGSRRRSAPRARPRRVPRPPASTPTSSTCRCGTNAEKMPAAFEPPPTHATTRFGSEPALRADLQQRLAPDHGLELAHHHRVRVRAEHRAEDVVRGRDVGDPVAQRLVDRVLERARARVHADDLGAEQLHPIDVERLAAHRPRSPM